MQEIALLTLNPGCIFDEILRRGRAGSDAPML